MACDNLEQEKSVTVASTGQEWAVTIVEGDERAVATFGLKKFAESFADGQRMRLNLTEYRARGSVGDV